MENDDTYLLVPKSFLQKIAEDQATILSMLGKTNSNLNASLGGYISEAEAKKLLNKRTTWFWKMRSSGLLPSSKVGGKNYYRMQDIQKLLDVAFTGNKK